VVDAALLQDGPVWAQPPRDHACVTRTKSEAAAAVSVGAGPALRKRDELLRPCFARTEPWLQAGKYVSALASELPRVNGWSIARRSGDRTPDRGSDAGPDATPAEPREPGYRAGQQADAGDNHGADLLDQARVIAERALRLITRGEPDQAERLLRHAYQLFTAADSEHEAAAAMGSIADIAYDRGDYDEALRIRGSHDVMVSSRDVR
jgi:hypothetical protein